jgi:hypothetical protein
MHCLISSCVFLCKVCIRIDCLRVLSCPFLGLRFKQRHRHASILINIHSCRQFHLGSCVYVMLSVKNAEGVYYEMMIGMTSLLLYKTILTNTAIINAKSPTLGRLTFECDALFSPVELSPRYCAPIVVREPLLERNAALGPTLETSDRNAPK